MNCDDVFDVLTRGPFPSGGPEDAAVEHHLSGCHDCRNLAEALRPAVDLFHESMSAVEARHLPGYRGHKAVAASGSSLAAAVAEAIRSVPARAEVVRRSPRQGSAPSLLWPLAAATLISAVACGMLWAMWAADDAAPSSSAAVETARIPAYQPTGDDLAQLVALQLPRRCQPSHERLSPPETVWHCCTDCHAASARPAVRPPVSALAVVMGQCGVCH